MPRRFLSGPDVRLVHTKERAYKASVTHIGNNNWDEIASGDLREDFKGWSFATKRK